MLIEHRGVRPTIHPSAFVAPTATVCGDVEIGEGCSVLFGAVVTAEGGTVRIGRSCIVMEQAVLRGAPRHALTLGDHVLVGSRASLSGCSVEEGAFLATGVTIFNGAVVGAGAEVRVNAVVHVNTTVPAGSMVPIGWVAVGRPASILPPHEHERIWAIQEGLDFPGTVFGVARSEWDMRSITTRYARALARHREDRGLD
jgi:carbonic anhydrase/acetyltransferase-like protein (isoleucine patch superfamily)